MTAPPRCGQPLDNLEWEHGHARRFGIVHVDDATQRRTLERSGL